MKFYLNAAYRGLCNAPTVEGTLLFGENLNARMRELSEVNRMSNCQNDKNSGHRGRGERFNPYGRYQFGSSYARSSYNYTSSYPRGGNSHPGQQSQGQRAGLQKKAYVKKIRVGLSWDEFVTGTIATGFEMVCISTKVIDIMIFGLLL